MNDVVCLTFLLISDLSGVVFSVTTLKTLDWIRLQKNGENLKVMFFIILYLDWYNGIVSYLQVFNMYIGLANFVKYNIKQICLHFDSIIIGVIFSLRIKIEDLFLVVLLYRVQQT